MCGCKAPSFKSTRIGKRLYSFPILSSTNIFLGRPGRVLDCFGIKLAYSFAFKEQLLSRPGLRENWVTRTSFKVQQKQLWGSCSCYFLAEAPILASSGLHAELLIADCSCIKAGFQSTVPAPSPKKPQRSQTGCFQVSNPGWEMRRGLHISLLSSILLKRKSLDEATDSCAYPKGLGNVANTLDQIIYIQKHAGTLRWD